MSGLNRLFVPDLGDQANLMPLYQSRQADMSAAVTAATVGPEMEGRKKKWREGGRYVEQKWWEVKGHHVCILYGMRGVCEGHRGRANLLRVLFLHVCLLPVNVCVSVCLHLNYRKPQNSTLYLNWSVCWLISLNLEHEDVQMIVSYPINKWQPSFLLLYQHFSCFWYILGTSKLGWNLF